MTNWTIKKKIIPDTIIERKDQIKFIKYFNKKYNIKEDLFYFDDIECVDATSDEQDTIPGADLNQPAKIIEKRLKEYFNLY